MLRLQLHPEMLSLGRARSPQGWGLENTQLSSPHCKRSPPEKEDFSP